MTHCGCTIPLAKPLITSQYCVISDHHAALILKLKSFIYNHERPCDGTQYEILTRNEKYQ